MSITRRKDGRAMQTFRIEGLAKPKTFYSSNPNDKRAEREIADKRAAFEKQLHHRGHNFLSLAEKMLEEREKSVGFKAMECYRVSLKHLSPFYSADLEDITPVAVQGLLEDLARQAYSYSTVHKVKTTFGMVLSYGIYHGLHVTDFRRVLKIPKSAKNNIRHAPDDTVIDLVVKNAASADFGLWAMCMLCTGYRRGELAALQKKAIDFENNTIRFISAVEFIGNRPHLKSKGKSEKSAADVPILAVLKPLLQDAVRDLSPDDFVFGGKAPLSETQIKTRWNKYCAEIGHTFTMHRLRHAYAKLLYKSGVDAKTAQRLLRHADIQTTMNIYTDFDDEVTRRGIEKVDDYAKNRFIFC